ncbi:MAG: hypothetical protein JNK82_41830 [Myxococcaceae bacterium]|nr:hypothetical protein [Myxococcaceae bacterium]
MLLRAALLVALFTSGAAFAQRESTRDALVRMEETLEIRLEGGSGLVIKDLVPVIVVSVKPAYEETKTWYPTAALAAIVKVFGGAHVRSCEACMVTRVYAQDGFLQQSTADLEVAEIIRLDQGARGTSAPARAAVWLDENGDGVSLKVVDLKNSRIVLAENFDGVMSEEARTRKNVSYARELDRRARGNSLVHTFVDFGVLPHQHFSIDWDEQFGDSNNNLAGFTFSMFDPVAGIGANYYRVIPQALNLTVGVQVLLSFPTALVQAISRMDQQVIDPLFTGVLVVRMPIAKSNFGVVATFSTNVRFAIGISLLDISLLPILP